jgi:hypothetical protein
MQQQTALAIRSVIATSEKRLLKRDIESAIALAHTFKEDD